MEERTSPFLSDEEYLNYLDGFANEFSLYQHISFVLSTEGHEMPKRANGSSR